MKIIFIITGLGLGGAERQVCELADCMNTLGHDVSIISLTGSAIILPTQNSITIYELKMQKNFLDFIRALQQAKKLITKLQPDIVHSHMFHANIFTRILRTFTPIKKLICTAHNSNEGGKFRMLAYRFTNFLADITTNVGSDAVKSFEKMKAVPRGKMLSIVNGINTNKFTPCSDNKERDYLRKSYGITGDTKIILAVGRLFEAKDYPNLLNAFALLSNQKPNVHLWIAGDGSLKNKLLDLSKDLKISQRVKFLGVRDDIPNLMQVSDIFVLSSEWEGLPLVIGEAMASEKIVVATNCSGTTELIGEYGFIVPIKDHYALKSNLILALNLSSVESAKIGSLARKRIVDNFSLQSVVEKWLDLYTTNNKPIN